MKTIHYVDSDNKYMGGFDQTQDHLTEVEAPAHGLDTWDGSNWVPYVKPESEAAQEALDATQGQVAGIGEEAIEILITKGLLTMGDFKQSSQDLLSERKIHKGKL